MVTNATSQSVESTSTSSAAIASASVKKRTAAQQLSRVEATTTTTTEKTVRPLVPWRWLRPRLVHSTTFNQIQIVISTALGMVRSRLAMQVMCFPVLKSLRKCPRIVIAMVHSGRLSHRKTNNEKECRVHRRFKEGCLHVSGAAGKFRCEQSG